LGAFSFSYPHICYGFQQKKINESQLSPSLKKNLNILAIILMIIVVVLIFAYHSKHYMGNLSG